MALKAMGVCNNSSQVTNLPIAKSQTRNNNNMGTHKDGSVYSKPGVPLPVLTSGG